MSVKFTNKTLWKSYLGILGVISTFVTIISFFVSIQDYPNWIQSGICVIFCISLVVIFVVMWWRANLKKDVKLKIKNTNVEIKIGDILQFNEEDEFSVITVNEYMDMTEDENLVAKKSIHGQFIEKMKSEERLEALKDYIKEANNEYITKAGEDVVNIDRKVGNNVRHPIGSSMNFDSYILTVFARDDEQERAYLSGEDYMKFLMQFWSNITNVGKTINIPIMGAGITRFEGDKPNKQALLEIILWSLKLGKFDNSYSDSKVNIIIHKNDADQIDFYHLQHNSNFR